MFIKRQITNMPRAYLSSNFKSKKDIIVNNTNPSSTNFAWSKAKLGEVEKRVARPRVVITTTGSSNKGLKDFKRFIGG